MESVASFFAQNRTLLIVIGIAALAFLLLRTTQSRLPDGGLDSALGGGTPVVVEMYSNT